MKIKRILSLAVVLAMVMAVVPMFGLTAGAAAPENDSQYYIDNAVYTFNGIVPKEGFSNGVPFGSDTLASTEWNGWTTNANGDAFRLFSYNDGDSQNLFIAPDANNNDDTPNRYTRGEVPFVLTASDAVKNSTKDKDYIVVEWDMSMGGENDFAYADIDGNIFDTFRFFTNSTNGLSYQYGSKGWVGNGIDNIFSGEAVNYEYEDNTEVGDGTAQSRALYRMVYVNGDDGYTASYYYQDGEDFKWIGTKTFAGDSFNGFGSMQLGYMTGNARIHDFKIYAGTLEASPVNSKIRNAMNGLAVANSAKSGTTLSLPNAVSAAELNISSVTWESDKSDVIDPKTGLVTTDKVDKVALTPTAHLTEGGEVKGVARTITVFPATRNSDYKIYFNDDKSERAGYYKLSGNNKISNGSFEKDGAFSLDGWVNTSGEALQAPGAGVDHWIDVTSTSAYNGSRGSLTGKFDIPDGNHALGSRWNDGLTSLCTINTSWNVEAGKSYYLSFYAKSDARAKGEKGIYAYYSASNTGKTAPSGEQAHRVTTTTEWQKYEYIFKADEDGVIGILAYNLGPTNDSRIAVRNYFDDFELYEATKVEPPEAPEASLGWAEENFTINYTGKDGQTIKVYHEDAESGEMTAMDGDGILLTVEKTGVAVAAKYTNRIYTATVTEAGVESVQSERTSVYKLVVDALASAETIAADKKKLINDVIAAGGIYIVGDALTGETNGIMKEFKDNTATIKDVLFNAGIGFDYKEGGIYIGSGTKGAAPAKDAEASTGKLYKTMKIDLEGGTISLSENDTITADAVTLSLDAVNVEFVETLIDELEANGTDADVALVPEL